MCELTARSKKAKKQFYYFTKNITIKEKLKKLVTNPRKEIGAHELKGKLTGKWSCNLGKNLRMVYEIDDEKKEIIVLAIGSHKVYK